MINFDFLLNYFKPRIQDSLKKKGSAERTLKIHTDIYEALRERDLKKVNSKIKVSIKRWKNASPSKSS